MRLEVEEADGAARIAIVTATQSTGQDHEGLFKGLLASQVAIPEGAIVLKQSQSENTPEGLGSFGSRTTIQAGSALHAAGKALVTHLVALEAGRRALPPDALVADPQAIRDASGKVLCTLAEALDRAAREGGFHVTGQAPVVNTFPSGCHVAEVRIDPETGLVECLGYWAVDDAGRVMSHHALEGQLRGGIAQGIAGALMDGHRFDPDGQVLTGTLMDYTLPRAGDMPPMQVLAHDVPSPTNPLGVKGAGEAGTTGGTRGDQQCRRPCAAPRGGPPAGHSAHVSGDMAGPVRRWRVPAPAGRFRDAPCVPTCRLEEIVTPDGDADPEFGELTVGVPCHEPLTPQFHAVHLGLDAVSAVVPASTIARQAIAQQSPERGSRRTCPRYVASRRVSFRAMPRAASIPSSRPRSGKPSTSPTARTPARMSH